MIRRAPVASSDPSIHVSLQPKLLFGIIGGKSGVSTVPASVLDSHITQPRARTCTLSPAPLYLAGQPNASCGTAAIYDDIRSAQTSRAGITAFAVQPG